MYENQNNNAEYVIFKVQDMAFGLDILDVQEIKRIRHITPVHSAPGYVRGIVNMRGDIVTILDPVCRFGIEDNVNSDSNLTIIIPDNNTLIGLLVDDVDDIVEFKRSDLAPPPSNMAMIQRQYITGILKQDQNLVAVIDKEMLIRVDSGKSIAK